MKLSDFDFEFDERLIALRPLSDRGDARLLVQEGGVRHHANVRDLPKFLRRGDLLVFNNTKVIPARLSGVRARGEARAKVEITLSAQDGQHWMALAKPLRKLKEGDVIEFSAGLSADVRGITDEGQVALEFSVDGQAFYEKLAAAGVMPLPPYIASKRPADAQDLEDYQPIFAQNEGAIAAPTASLHFDASLLAALKAKGIRSTFVTLHVGIGTFLPVKVDKVVDHKMHGEWGEVTADAAEDINEVKKAGGRIIPVGTTALRLLETAGRSGSMTQWQGETDIFITPGFEFKIADGLMTNFHLPKSTLMMLVSALMGRETILDLYKDAIAREYRFFSYGDSSLLLPNG